MVGFVEAGGVGAGEREGGGEGEGEGEAGGGVGVATEAGASGAALGVAGAARSARTRALVACSALVWARAPASTATGSAQNKAATTHVQGPNLLSLPAP